MHYWHLTQPERPDDIWFPNEEGRRIIVRADRRDYYVGRDTRS